MFKICKKAKEVFFINKVNYLVMQLIILILVGGILVSGCQIKNNEKTVETAITIGTQSQTVKEIQKKLINWGYLSGQVDGIYGKKTKDAIIKFQKKNGLNPDGVVGKATLAKLGITEKGESSSGATSSAGSADRNLLAKVINGEARGESFDGQVAVGAVILNRVEHPSFPNTIAGVVYQPLAFTAIADGQINAAMYESCYRAADVALSGVDPTGGAIYYYNPATATSKWIFSRPTIKTIGKHVFAK